MSRGKRPLVASLLLLALLAGGIWLMRERPPSPEDQRAAMRLRLLHGWWVESGSPELPQIERYVTYSAPSTGFVYSATHRIHGREHPGLFAYRDGVTDKTYVVDRRGEVLVLDHTGHARLLKLQPEGQPPEPSLLARIRRRFFE
jgi:hypothetical protein